PLLRQQRDDRSRQWRNNLVFANLFLVIATERIDPMQIEPSVARAQVKLVPLDYGDDIRLDAVEREIESTVIGRPNAERDLAFTDRQWRGSVAIGQRDLLLGVMALAERKQPLPPPDRHPAEGLPRRMRPALQVLAWQVLALQVLALQVLALQVLALQVL